MRIENKKPPIWNEVIAAGMKPSETVVFTYGDTIYNPGKVEIPDYIIHHEATHSAQQGIDPDAWWSRYLADPYFRLDQEVAAYARQYEFICRKVKDREKRNRILIENAGILAGPIYGNMISQSAAMEMIRKKANV